MPTLDDLLRFIAWLSTIAFAIYAVYQFVRVAVRDGLEPAFLRLLSARVLIPFLVVLAIWFISAALVFVQPTQVAVVVSMVSPGGVRPQPLTSGLHLIIPILEKEEIYPIYWQTYTMSNALGEGAKTGDDSVRARTRDGQEVRLDNSIIFRVDQEQAVTVHIDWQGRYVEEFVRPVVRSYMRTQVSQFTVEEVNSSARKDLEATLDRLLRDELASQGFIMDQFLLRDITFTDEYSKSIEDKQVALEGIGQAANEAEQIRNLAAGERDRLATEAAGRKDRFILEAEGQAQAILLEAEAQAAGLKLIAEALAGSPDLLTYRYIDKLSPNIRAMLVPNDAPLILPLQDLVDGETLQSSSSITETVAGPTPMPTSEPSLPSGPNAGADSATPESAPALPTPPRQNEGAGDGAR